ncbi:hypothetical protein BDC45DRAFT_292587 [Circinella umbellata]|nr:hypothetical protein BDC45DRAFT_292587 [Circinella umbellata]
MLFTEFIISPLHTCFLCNFSPSKKKITKKKLILFHNGLCVKKFSFFFYRYPDNISRRGNHVVEEEAVSHSRVSSVVILNYYYHTFFIDGILLFMKIKNKSKNKKREKKKKLKKKRETRRKKEIQQNHQKVYIKVRENTMSEGQTTFPPFLRYLSFSLPSLQKRRPEILDFSYYFASPHFYFGGI